MLKKVAIVIAALAVSFTASAGEEFAMGEQALAPAKLVVYRAEESSKTRRIKFHVSADGVKLGRLKYSTPLVAELSAGDVVLSTSLPGTPSLQIRLQAGHTYYVHSRVKRLGQTVTPVLVVVEEQFALTQLPAVDGTI